MIAYTVQTKVQGPMGTPTVLDLQGTTGTDFSGLMIDADGNLEFNNVVNAKAFPIGFDFGYNGKLMKYFLVATNGMIQLSPTETVSSVVHKSNVTVFTDSGNHDAVIGKRHILVQRTAHPVLHVPFGNHTSAAMDHCRIGGQILRKFPSRAGFKYQVLAGMF